MANHEVNTGRRRFLTTTTAVVGAIGAGFAAVPFVTSFKPSARAQTAGAPVTVNISKIDNEPGMRLIQQWRGKPVWIVRRTPEQLESIASLYKPPVTRTVVIDNVDSADVEELISMMGPFPMMVWRDGPRVGSDRSITLYKFVALLQEQGFTPEQCYKLLESADKRWGKFHLRPDADKEMIRLITRVYGERFSDG